MLAQRSATVKFITQALEGHADLRRCLQGMSSTGGTALFYPRTPIFSNVIHRETKLAIRIISDRNYI